MPNMNKIAQCMSKLWFGQIRKDGCMHGPTNAQTTAVRYCDNEVKLTASGLDKKDQLPF
jgi:hypothetical protein